MTYTVPKDFYCSEKFTWLTIDIEKGQWFSCCAATPQHIDMHWINNNPGKLFTMPALVQERQQMLAGEKVSSCNTTCWNPEQRGLVSRRMIFSSLREKHDQLHVDSPRNLHIVLGSTCNMTCSYCCKNYSSAWLRDIIDHGSYMDNDRFNLTNRDRVLLKVSNPEHVSREKFQILMDELRQITSPGKVNISGGEPFLYNNLAEIVHSMSEKNDIIITTGLGVNPQRFRKYLSNFITNKHRISFSISAENCDRFYEFNRFGNSWQNFETNLAEIESQGFSWTFYSVLSNLTVFNFKKFTQRFSDKHIRYEFCNEPDFLNIKILDDISKDRLARSLSDSSIPFRDIMIENMMNPVTHDLRMSFSRYVMEFSKRRSLDLSIYPDSFVKWIYDTR